jgi:hypothetical protein
LRNFIAKYSKSQDFSLSPGTYDRAEPTVQQEETPQPPPEKPPVGTAGEMLFPEPEEQQNDDNIFLTSPEEHFGHLVSFWLPVMLCSRENRSQHFRHIYS